MKTVNVEFIVKVDKEIYSNTPWKTREEFFNHLVFEHIASDYHFIANSVEHQMKGEEKDKYIPYLETLKNIKEHLLNSATYEVINQEGSVEKIKVNCHFNYYDNVISDLERTVEVEIFTTSIRKNYFMAKYIVRLVRAVTSDREKEIEDAVKMYKHIGDFLNEAKTTVLINGKEVNFEKFAVEEFY